MTIFTSPRLVCRRWRRDDRDDLLRVYGDADAMRFVGDGSILTPEEADRWLEVTAANYARRGYGMFTLEDRGTGAIVGFAGLVHPGDQVEAEIKYAFDRRWWGRGLATEAVTHLLAAGAAQFGLRHVIATIAPDHGASQRVVAKAGMTRAPDRVEEDGSITRVFDTFLAPPTTDVPDSPA